MSRLAPGMNAREHGQKLRPQPRPDRRRLRVAHYFSLLVYQGQALGYLASDPLGAARTCSAPPGWTVDNGVISTAAVWYVQSGLLVPGHVAGLALAHDRALARCRAGVVATRSQYWMLAVMVGYTSLGLWLLSTIKV